MMRYPRIVLTALTIACLAPWLNKAFEIDDPLFLWSAEQILRDPADFYGIKVNWYYELQDLSSITKNPPLCSYYLALVASVTGFREVPLHLAMMAPAVALVLGSYELARRLCHRPLLAAAATLAMPAVLISSTSVMCDVLMTALWVWSLVLWMRGIDAGRPLPLVGACLLMAACALTKYFGIAVVPLALWYAIVRTRRPGWWLLYPLITLGICAAFEAYFRARYGLGAFWSAAEYAADSTRQGRLTFAWRGLVVLIYTGGALLPALVLAPWLWSARTQGAWLALAILLLVALAALGAMPTAKPADFDFHTDQGLQWNALLHATLFVVAGAHVLALVAADAWQRRDVGSALLAAWVLGTLVFTAWLNWTINGRSILPAAPAVAILLARRLDLQSSAAALTGFRAWSLRCALGLSLAFTLTLVWADCVSANANRDAAAALAERFTPAAGTPHLWLGGHWGFQYYLQRAGGRSLDLKYSELALGDLIVLPGDNAVGMELPAEWKVIGKLETPLAGCVTTICDRWQTSFYSIEGGPMPYRFARVPMRQFHIYDPFAQLRARGAPRE